MNSEENISCASQYMNYNYAYKIYFIRDVWIVKTEERCIHNVARLHFYRFNVEHAYTWEKYFNILTHV